MSRSLALVGGVADVADRLGGWDLLPLHYSEEPALSGLLRMGGVDGVIGAFLSDRWIAELRSLSPVPMINTSTISDITSIPSVVVDDEAMGRLAARHFHAHRYFHLAFEGIRSCAYSSGRERGFRREAEAAGVTVVRSRETTVGGDDRGRWLAGLPRPLGVFCADDRVARQVIDDGRRYGLSVPGDVAVVGAGDSPMESFRSGVSISSIPLPLREIGRRAAERMHEWLRGVEPSPRCVRVEPAALRPRESSSLTCSVTPLVSRALAHIEQRLAGPLNVAGLAAQLNVSRRLLELRFREDLECSPCQAIVSRRMDLAARLLNTTDRRMEDIAERCGYPDLPHFYRRFRQRYGMSPGAFRRRATPT